MNIKDCIKDNKLKVVVKPNANKTEVMELNVCNIGGNSKCNNSCVVKIAVKAIPDKNKANIELVKFLSKLLKKKVRIVSGMKSKEKVLEII